MIITHCHHCNSGHCAAPLLLTNQLPSINMLLRRPAGSSLRFSTVAPAPPALRRNRFKAALLGDMDGSRSAAPQLGLWASAGCPQVTELASLVPGITWLVIDMEHTPNTLQCVLSQLQSAQASGCADAVVRVPSSDDPVVVKRVLDLGAQTLMFPAVNTAEEAAAAVASTRYPPNGHRGVMTTARMTGYAVDSDALRDYYHNVERETCIITQVESAEAVEAIPAMASVEGVDAMFIGPSDLAASMGHLGHPSHPEVSAMIRRAFALSAEARIPCGAISGDAGTCRQYLDNGASFVAVGTDLSILGTGLRKMVHDVGAQ